MKRIIKSILGVVAILIGVTILLWCLWNAIIPNEHFHFRLLDIPRLFIPLLFVWIGWRWIRGDAAKETEYTSELTLTLKLTDSEFGAQTERTAIIALKHQLEAILEEWELGKIDGEEFGRGECSMFIQTNSAAEAEALVNRVLASQTPPLSFSISKADS